MDLVIEPAVVLAVLGDVDHALEAAIERGVKNPALRLRAAFHRNLAERLVPARLRRGLHRLEAPLRNLPLQILLRLLHADERNAIAKLQRPCVCTRGRDHALSSPASSILQLDRRAELAIDIRLHAVESLFAADRVAAFDLQVSRHAGSPAQLRPSPSGNVKRK